jgi:hypothetical protein
MANSLNITNIPAPRVPFIDERTGLMAREWYRFFLNLFVLTGSGNNPITLEELQLGPPNQPDLTELLIQINQNIAPQYEDQSGDFLATLNTAQLMSMMSRFENAEAAIQGAYLNPIVQTGTIANYNLDGSPTLGGVAYGTGPALAVSAAGSSGQVLTSAGAAAPTWATPTTGTVSSVSVVSANGLAGTVATATTTPAITLSTTITGLLKGNGTAISAAVSGTDYAPATSGTSILYGNGAGGFSNVTIGTGVAFSAGTLSATGSGGTVTSVTGTAPVVSSGGATPVISMAAATTSVNGYLTSTDWTTFNNKGSGTVTSVTGTSPVASSGGATPAISMPAATTSVSGYLTSTDWTTFNNKGSGTVTSVSGTAGRITSTGGATPVIDLVSGIATPGTTGSVSLIPVVTIDTYGRVTSITTAANPQGTVTSVAALTLGTTGTDLSSTVATGTTTPVITLQVPTASASNRGALSAADWTTFNSKGSGTVTSVSFTGGVITVATPTTTPAFTVAGTSGGIPYFSSASTWATSAALAAGSLVQGGGAGVAPSTITTGTGVVTALGVNTGTAGAFVVNGGALGTPSSGTVTNLTGTASININGTVGATTASTGAFTSATFSTTVSVTGMTTLGTTDGTLILTTKGYFNSRYAAANSLWQWGPGTVSTGNAFGFTVGGTNVLDLLSGAISVTGTLTSSSTITATNADVILTAGGQVKVASTASASGTAVVHNANGYYYDLLSSRRYKENFRAIPNDRAALDRFLKLTPELFDLKNDLGDKDVINFIAEDAADAEKDGLLSLTNYNSEGAPQSLRDYGFSAYQQLVLQDHEARLAALQAEFQAYKAAHP